MGRIAIALGCGLVLGASLEAQQLPIRRGDRIRVAGADSASRGLWRVGHVLKATRQGLLLAPASAPGDTMPIGLAAPMRLELSRQSRTGLIVGAGMGLAVGTATGFLISAATFGSSWDDPGHTGEVIAGALMGGGLGVIGGWLFAPRRWTEIPLNADGIPAAPLERPVTHPASFARNERWGVFDASVDDFAAFFAAHRTRLDVVEGLWETEGGEGGYGARMAIARDRRFEGYQYVAVALGSSAVSGQTQTPGWILFAMRQADTPGHYELRYVGRRLTRWYRDLDTQYNRQGQWRREDALLESDAESLLVRSADGSVTRLVKLHLEPR